MTNETKGTWFDQYNQFANACSIPQGSLLDPPNFAAIELAKKLVIEEWEVETKEALTRYTQNPSMENMVEVADGIGDSIYVLCQLARSLGIPLNAVWNRIQSANMAKCLLAEDGTFTVKRREDGKILKPEGWKPPDIWGVLKRHSDLECVQRKAMGAENWPKVANQGEEQ